MPLITIIVSCSILFQLISAIMAVRLISITGRRIAWLLIALAIALMTIRRIESLYLLLSGEVPTPSLVAFEVIGLVTSVLMLGGINRIRPLFVSIVRSEEEHRTMNSQLTTLSADQEKLIADLQDSLEKIKTLKGLLPICASCKKIRDDKGYWNQIEAYVSTHTEAEFTHGLCPECAKKIIHSFSPTNDACNAFVLSSFLY